jgi:peptidoglycan/xylan/chitin deacetylase (PgdA/CDA1 family)
MRRRSFIRTSIMGGLAVAVGSCSQSRKSHILTLSFDDGMKKSFYKIADIFEQNNLHACLNVIASGHLASFMIPNEYHADRRGDFSDWNILRKRGHEIMPHSWDHSDLSKMQPDQAREDITRCLEYFEKHLEGFKASEAVYNFAFNASTPDLEQFALTKVRAVRTGGESPVNPIPVSYGPVRLSCSSFGPGKADKWVEQTVSEFINSSGGWLVLNLHGLDEEGWGPLGSVYLGDLLERMTKIEYLEVLPAGEVLKRTNAQ